MMLFRYYFNFSFRCYYDIVMISLRYSLQKLKGLSRIVRSAFWS